MFYMHKKYTEQCVSAFVKEHKVLYFSISMLLVVKEGGVYERFWLPSENFLR